MPDTGVRWGGDMPRYLTVVRWPGKPEVSGRRGPEKPAASVFTQTCRTALQAAGFAVDTGRQFFADAGVVVDLIATNRHGISFYITCRGAEQVVATAAGKASATRAYKKGIAAAWALHTQGWGPSLLLTSYAPDTEKARSLLAGVNPEVLFDVVNPVKDGRRLRWLASADERQLSADLDRRRTAIQRG